MLIVLQTMRRTYLALNTSLWSHSLQVLTAGKVAEKDRTAGSLSLKVGEDRKHFSRKTPKLVAM